MSEELLNLTSELNNEELDIEGHAQNAPGAEDKGEDEVEAHLLDNSLLDQNLQNDKLLDL